MHSSSDQFGYIEDPVFQVAIVIYLGQLHLLMVLVVGRFIGKKCAQLDQYGEQSWH